MFRKIYNRSVFVSKSDTGSVAEWSGRWTPDRDILGSKLQSSDEPATEVLGSVQ